jgi:hypothetical protein
MQMPRGREDSCSFQTSALDGISCQRHAPAALYPRWWNPGTPWIGGWVCLRAGLDTEASGKSKHVTRMSKSLETPALDEEEKSGSRSSRLSPIPHWIWSCVDLTVELHVVAKGIIPALVGNGSQVVQHAASRHTGRAIRDIMGSVSGFCALFPLIHSKREI